MSNLEISGLSAGYGHHQVLHEVNLSLRAGMTGIFGHNGAGKTTLLRTVAGLLRPTAGHIRFEGQDAREMGGAVAFVPQDDNVFSGLSVEENLRVAGRRMGPDDFASMADRVFGLFPDLRTKRRDQAAQLSGGQKKMLAFSLALFQRPRLLLLDEPSAGLAPLMVERMMQVISRVAEEDQCTVVLVEQNLKAAAPIVSAAVVLRHGRVQYTADRVEERVIRELWGLA